MTINTERSENGTIQRSEMAVDSLGGQTKGAFDGREECLALQAAGSIGDMIGSEHVESGVELGQALRFEMRVRDEWQHPMTALCNLISQERHEVRAGANLAVLPCRFQTARMSKAAGGESGIGQLPDEP